MAGEYNPGKEQYQATASPNIVTERAAQGKANQLLQALGSDSTEQALAQFNQQYEAKKLEDQKGKFDWYVEQFRQDNSTGAVSQAQVKERFPETVPVIAARIAEAVGHKEGMKGFQSVIDEINSNDNLKLDTNARNAFIEKKRAEVVQSIGQGNEFYGAGAVKAMDGLINQHQQSWASATAKYHQDVQTEAFSGAVTSAINSGGAAKLVDLDADWGKSSSLNNLERKKIVVDTAIDVAFTNDDPAVLESIPTVFLNADAKAKLSKAKTQLTSRRMGDLRDAEYLKGLKREETLKNNKVAMISQAAAGGRIDPAAYRDDPESFDFAMRMRSVSMVDPGDSAANAARLRRFIFAQASFGGKGMAEAELTNQIAGNPNISVQDQEALLKDLPKLVEGRNIMQGDRVQDAIRNRLAPSLSAMDQSIPVKIGKMDGTLLRSQVMRGYEQDIHDAHYAHFETHQAFPNAMESRAIINEATDRAEKRISEAMKFASGAEPPAAAAPTAQPKAAPKAATPLPKGVTKLN